MRSLDWTIPLLLSAAAAARAQDAPPDVAYPTLPARAADAAGFAPPGWAVEYAQRGDLDADRRDDLLLVLRMHDSRNVLDSSGLGADKLDTNPRILAVALATDRGYRLAAQDHALIPRPASPFMDDYLDGEGAIAIARGGFSVALHAWASAGSWGTSNVRFGFRRQDGCFRLIGYDRDDLHRDSGETTTTSVDFLTGKARIGIGNIADDGVDKTRWRKLAARGPICLQDVGDGFAFDAGVPEDAMAAP